MFRKIIFPFCFGCLPVAHLFSQTFTGGGGVITDNSTQIVFNLNVTGLPASIDSISFGLQSVCINISHNNDADLDIDLVAPDGTRVKLTSQNGGSGNNYTGTCFTPAAANPVYMSSAPFTGNFKPQGDLGIVNNFQNPNGTWKLSITDLYTPTQGSLTSWSLTFGSSPFVPFPFESSNLPIVMINTLGQVVKDDPRIVCDMGIIYNGTGVRNYKTDPFNHYNGKIAMEIRGSTSQQYPKKSFGIETQDILGNNSNVSLLGMPSQNDWILYGAYPDKTFMRNTLCFDIHRRAGNYCSRTRFCELFIDGSYMGIYEFVERVKVDNSRVDIEKLLPTDNAGDALTGGYIVKVDKLTGTGSVTWTSPFSSEVIFSYHDPDDVALTATQEQYIQNYVTAFETALNAPTFADPVLGYRPYIKEYTFIDFMILQELGRTVDGYRSSSFLHKERDSKGGKLRAGPMWDFNLSFGNADYCDAYLTAGWQYNFNTVCPSFSTEVPFWWIKFQQDTGFNNEYRCRWEQLYADILDPDSLDAWVDSVALLLGESQSRNFAKWPILGVYVNWNYFVGATYQEEVDYLKWWLRARGQWMDANIPGTCWPGTTGVAKEEDQNEILFYPNPFAQTATMEVLGEKYAAAKKLLSVFDVTGRLVLEKQFASPLVQVQRGNLGAGIYFWQLSSENEMLGKGKMVVE